MKGSRIAASWTALLMAVTLLVPAFAAADPPPARTKLRVALMPYLGFGIFHLAEREGFFAREGIEVEFVRFDRSYKGMGPLLKGDLDVHAGASNAAFLNTIARGGELKIVADKGFVPVEGCESNYLMVRRDLAEEPGKLEDFSWLRGRMVSAHTAAYNEFLLDLILGKDGLSVEDVENVKLPYPALPEAFKKRNLAAAVVSEPWVTRVLSGGHAVKAVPAREVTPGYQRASIMFGPNLLRDNRDAGRRFILAYLKAVVRYNEGKTARNLAVMAEHTGFDEEFLKGVCWTALREDGKINTRSVLEFQSWAVERGFVEEKVTEEQFWDPSFIEYANGMLRGGGR